MKSNNVMTTVGLAIGFATALSQASIASKSLRSASDVEKSLSPLSIQRINRGVENLNQADKRVFSHSSVDLRYKKDYIGKITLRHKQDDNEGKARLPYLSVDLIGTENLTQLKIFFENKMRDLTASEGFQDGAGMKILKKMTPASEAFNKNALDSIITPTSGEHGKLGLELNGHSAGGARAILFERFLKKSYSDHLGPSTVVTFAATPAFTRQASDYAQAQIGEKSIINLLNQAYENGEIVGDRIWNYHRNNFNAETYHPGCYLRFYNGKNADILQFKFDGHQWDSTYKNIPSYLKTLSVKQYGTVKLYGNSTFYDDSIYPRNGEFKNKVKQVRAPSHFKPPVRKPTQDPYFMGNSVLEQPNLNRGFSTSGPNLDIPAFPSFSEESGGTTYSPDPMLEELIAIGLQHLSEQNK